MCETLEEIFVNNGIIHKKCKLGRDGLAYNLRHGGKSIAKRFFDYIYKDNTIHLKRKYEKFIAVLG